MSRAWIYTKVLGFSLDAGVLTSVGSDQSDVSPGSVAHSGGVFGSEAAETKSRPKRCTCYSYKDKECVYYCHLDIIWINTPERTVPYGMSSYQGPQRIRRAVVGQPTEHQWAKTQRCTCVLDADPKCHDFCLLSRQFSFLTTSIFTLLSNRKCVCPLRCSDASVDKFMWKVLRMSVAIITKGPVPRVAEPLLPLASADSPWLLDRTGTESLCIEASQGSITAERETIWSFEWDRFGQETCGKGYQSNPKGEADKDGGTGRTKH
ncbi:putative endothelin-3 [Scophthalmus maximus]|uniref:Endothelin-3 n=1 Tax=Scophthalmus maximus TaxID=52904 RepID=A0A2U9C385_SCOMX|nr:putative endothelin-3 [Scophthalmus maximus]